MYKVVLSEGKIVMKCRLTTQEKLKDLRYAKGLTQTEIGEATGLGKSTISNYESDEWKELQLYALKELADFYEVPLAYLIGLTDNLTESETDISELHLDDETVQILKSEKYNNRLICEIIKHPAFGNLISDLEIYVDNLAGSYIHFLNSYIEMLIANDAVPMMISPQMKIEHLDEIVEKIGGLMLIGGEDIKQGYYNSEYSNGLWIYTAL